MRGPDALSDQRSRVAPLATRRRVLSAVEEGGVVVTPHPVVGDGPASDTAEVLFMERKVFWLLFLSLGLLADFVLPLVWGVIATIPILLISWWVAYRSEWFG